MIKDKQYWLNKRQRKAKNKMKERGVHIHLTDDMIAGRIPHDAKIIILSPISPILSEDWIVKINRIKS